MTKHVGYFGGRFRGHITLENGQREVLPFSRELWFDKDIDGRWLIGVVDTADTGRTGAIVVRDATVSAFIEILGNLVADPEQFADELVLHGSGGDRSAPER